MAHRLIFLFAAAAFFPNSASARDLVVTVENERCRPALEEVLSQLEPGDTLRFEPAGAVVRDEIQLKDVRGTAEAPIVIDGSGCTFIGTESVKATEWEAAGGGLYKSAAVAARLRLSPNLLQRMFLVFDGRVERMGRVSKGPQPPLPPPENLKPGQWTHDPAQKLLYVRIAPEQELEKAGIAIPERQSGVMLTGTAIAHLHLRNIKVRHFLNDGFNIHSRAESIRFSDIVATECGDDGFSAHDDTSVTVERFQAEGNATGFCNVNRSRFVASEVKLTNNLAYEIYITDTSQNRVNGLQVASGARRLITARGSEKDAGNCLLELSDASLKGSGTVSIEKRSEFIGREIEIDSGAWMVSGSARINNSRLAARELTLTGDWSGSGNTYQFGSITDQGRSVSAEEFSAGATKPESP